MKQRNWFPKKLVVVITFFYNVRSLKFLLLFIFIFSGLIKWLMPNPDPTLAFGIFVLINIVFQVLNTRSVSSLIFQVPVLIFFLFHAYILLGLLYTPSTEYGSIKVGKIFFNLIAFIAPIILLRKNSDFHFFIKSTIFVGVLAIVFLCYQYADNKLSIFKIREGENGVYPEYMSVSYFLGTFIIIFLFSFSRMGKILPLILIAFFLMLQLAAKGPILFLIISLLIVNYTDVSNWIAKNRSKFTFYFILSLSVIVLGYFVGFYDQLLNRLLFIDGVENDQSSLQRVLFAIGAFNIFMEFPFFGGGIGSFGILHLGSDVRASAHNLILEVLSELGIFGFFLISSFFIYLNNYRKRSLNSKDFKNRKLINTLLLYNIFQSMVASYLEDSRILYFFIGISLAYYYLSISSLKRQINS